MQSTIKENKRNKEKNSSKVLQKLQSDTTTLLQTAPIKETCSEHQ